MKKKQVVDDINSLEKVQGRRIGLLETKVETMEIGLELILGSMGVKIAKEIAVSTISAWNDPPAYFLKPTMKKEKNEQT